MAGKLSRHLPPAPCPICGGHSRLPQGYGTRCAGFSLDTVAFCTREEHAGSLKLTVTTSPPSFMHRLYGECGCGIEHGPRLEPEGGREPTRRSTAARTTIPVGTRDALYRELLQHLDIRAEAKDDLRRRGLTDEHIQGSVFRSIPRKGQDLARVKAEMVSFAGEQLLLACPGFHDKNGRLTIWSAIGERDGYIVPYVDEGGRITGLQLKLLGDKYLTASGALVSEIYHVAGRRQRDLYVTEGGLKAEVAATLGSLWVMGIPGQALQAEHIEVVRRLAPERVAVALDREVNSSTDRARERWLDALWDAGLPVYDVVWEAEVA